MALVDIFACIYTYSFIYIYIYMQIDANVEAYIIYDTKLKNIIERFILINKS